MPFHVEFSLTPRQAVDPARIDSEAIRAAGLEGHTQPVTVRVRRRSLDARQHKILVNFSADVYVDEPVPEVPAIVPSLRHALNKRQVIIVGAGPAGYFAALELLNNGIKPIVLDRGKDVRARRKDLRNIQQFGIVNPDSNYCFGEGGAGAYSDGKLYTRSSKRGDVHRVLRLLVEHGAQTDILIDAHPHIGSNKLPQVVAAIRDTIISLGGVVQFESRVSDFIIRDGVINGVIVNDSTEWCGDAVVVATGHSARDIYHLCRKRNVRTEFKSFAVGVRAEHPQELIDWIQYGQRPRDKELSAASYRLATQVDGRGVYSFCMCPGGLIVPSATAPGEIVVNGMSMSRRDSRYANSGIVVEIRHEDLVPYHSHGEHAGLAFQQELAPQAFSASNDGSQRAPAQALVDFCDARPSKTLPSCSYIPGTTSLALHELLPKDLSGRLQTAFRTFGRSMKGYYTNDALITLVESRTSTPVKIPRDPISLEHVEIRSLYPCGEGAGYAGGIVSAAMDGQRVATAIAQRLGAA